MLTLHDPLAAVSVFHPELCRFERGTVRVETVRERDMGGTAFTPCPDGNAEIARSVDREAFYRILSDTLCGSVPPLMRKRAEAAGAVGKAWLAGLDALIAKLESQWHITVDAPLAGGTHAYVARARGRDGSGNVLKIDMPESMGHGAFSNSITAMELVGGRGYAKLYAYDEEARACLLEELGPPLKELHYPVERQIEIICGALEQSWQAPVPDASLPTGDDSIAWFRDFLGSTWEQLRRPCPERVLRQAMEFLRIREARKNPASYVLLHGDAHSTNTLQELSSPDRFKLVDPDGIFYEKAYDLGVLMREWPEEYRDDPVGSGRKRCRTLHRLTGVDEEAIWQWGFLQTVSTGFVLLQIGQEEAGKTLLNLAEAWCRES